MITDTHVVEFFGVFVERGSVCLQEIKVIFGSCEVFTFKLFFKLSGIVLDGHMDIDYVLDDGGSVFLRKLCVFEVEVTN
mgnify:CR=1 FL=1